MVEYKGLSVGVRFQLVPLGAPDAWVGGLPFLCGGEALVYILVWKHVYYYTSGPVSPMIVWTQGMKLRPWALQAFSRGTWFCRSRVS